MSQIIYLGPPIGSLTQNKVFKDGLPDSVIALVELYPDINVLLVPLESMAAAMKAIKKKGTPEYAAYTVLGGIVSSPSTGGSTSGGGVTAQSGPIDVDLHKNAVNKPYTPTGGNASLTFTIRGTNAARTVFFELADPSGVYGAVPATSLSDPKKAADRTTGGTDTVPEVWQIEVPAGYTFRARPSGGNASITGKATVSSDMVTGLMRTMQGVVQQLQVAAGGTQAVSLTGSNVELAIDVTAPGLQTARQASPGANSLLRLNIYGEAAAVYSIQIQGQMYDGVWRTLPPADAITGNDVASTITKAGVYDFDVAGWQKVIANVVTVTGGKVHAKGGFLP